MWDNLRAPLAFVNQIIDVSGESRFRFYAVLHKYMKMVCYEINFRFEGTNPVRRMRSHDRDIHNLREVENADSLVAHPSNRRTGRA